MLTKILNIAAAFSELQLLWSLYAFFYKQCISLLLWRSNITVIHNPNFHQHKVNSDIPDRKRKSCKFRTKCEIGGAVIEKCKYQKMNWETMSKG